MKRLVLCCAVLLLSVACGIGQTGTGKVGSVAPESLHFTNGPVAEYVAESNADLGWSVQENTGKMAVRYGTDRDHLNLTAEAAPGTDPRNFHAHLQGMVPSTRYYFQIVQQDQPVGNVGTFRTVASGSSPVRSEAVIPK
jgi:phosphodiesterase/alkaline phosphatase D-like protein